MRLSYHLVGTFIAGLAAAVRELPSECLGNDLFFNKANAVTLAGCTELAYRCHDKVVQINSTNEAIPANCTHHLYNVTVDKDMMGGSLWINGMTEASSITVNGTIAPGSTDDSAVDPSLLNVFALPDLENVTSDFRISHAPKLMSFVAPKLKNVGGSFEIDLSGGPSVDLRFPNLTYAHNLKLSGKIDVVELPLLSHTSGLEVYTTGQLDCPAFVERIGKTVDTGGQAILCRSETSATTSSSSAPTPTPTGSSARIGIHGAFVALAAFIACMLVL